MIKLAILLSLLAGCSGPEAEYMDGMVVKDDKGCVFSVAADCEGCGAVIKWARAASSESCPLFNTEEKR